MNHLDSSSIIPALNKENETRTAPNYIPFRRPGSRRLKLTFIVGTIDLSLKNGCTPAWWQLFSALHQQGHELTVIPYVGREIHSLWWSTYKNPSYWQSVLFLQLNELLTYKKKKNSKRSIDSSSLIKLLIKYSVVKAWKKILRSLLNKDLPDALIFIMVPVSHMYSLIEEIKREYSLPIYFYEGDVPDILPEFYYVSRLKANYLDNVDLSIFDGIFINSIGGIKYFKKRGVKTVVAQQWGVDPYLFSPIDVQGNYKFDVFFYGYGNWLREKWVNDMLFRPAKLLQPNKFLLGGQTNIISKYVHYKKDIPLAAWMSLACQSKINLNITRKYHAAVYATSTSRPFELASLACAIVSNPINGLYEWFTPKKEIMVAHSYEEAVELYKFLLDDDEYRLELGKRARERVLREHTYMHRANNFISNLK